MPLYEYECQHCGRRTEKIQKFSDAPLTACPHCGGPVEKVLHAPAVSFKGGGWYADLYSSGKPASSGGKESGDKGGKSEAGTSTASGESSGASASKESAPASTSAPSTPAASAPASSSNSK